jgi:rod shape determining protein RodA
MKLSHSRPILFVRLERILLGIAVLLSLAGLFVLINPFYSGWDFWIHNLTFLRQLLYTVLGLLLYYVISRKTGEWYHDKHFIRILSFVGVGLLLLVLVFGSRVNGAKSWFDLGLFSLQPADFVKIIFALFLAHFYERRHIFIKHPSVLITPLLALVGVALLLLLQPDFGTMVIFIGIWFFCTVAAGLWWRHTLILVISSLCLILLAWSFVFAGYQKDRILTFVNPERDPFGAGYNVIQSKIAIGAAGYMGYGVGGGTQGRFGFLPEHHTDFIYASFVEEWGAIGGLLVIAGMGTIICALFVTAVSMQKSVDTLYIVGYAALLTVHSVIHIGMNMGALPVTGLPMPFMSFGGSHIITEYIGLGIAIAMLRRSSLGNSLGRQDVQFLGPQKLSIY